MIKKIIPGILLSTVLISSAFADSELWSTNTFQFPFYKAMFNVIPELRFKNNMGDWYYLRTYIGPSTALNKQFDLAVYLAPSWTKTGGSWTASLLGYFDLVYKQGLPWFAFSNRARFEENFTSNTFIYRNLFLFKNGNCSAGDELFYNTKKGFFDEGRSTISYAPLTFNGIEFSLGYLLRRQKTNSGDEWTRTGVLNLGAKIVY